MLLGGHVEGALHGHGSGGDLRICGVAKWEHETPAREGRGRIDSFFSLYSFFSLPLEL
jgi:hypothetical protein